MNTLPSPLLTPDACLSEDVVLAFHHGETTETDRQRIHGHIDTCPGCRKLLMATAGLEGSVSALGGVELDSMERMATVMGGNLHMTTFAKGKQLAHRFDVIRFVDRGGMGEVYEAFDPFVDARIALKALLYTPEEGDPVDNRLGEEVKLARRIAHPNVCHIYDLHEHREAGHPPLRFLAMEFVDGVTLKARLMRGELAIDEACAIARQLLLGLGAAHAAGVLHLDFKSQNIMLRHGKEPVQAVVMDFSLSRAFENELRLRTSERHAAGSIGYMSPEQLECRSTLSPAADVYAFGVVFYEMLTGRMPFQGDSPAAIMLKQLKSRAAPPSRLRPGVSPELDDFVSTCLGRHARSRFQSASSALEALERCIPSVASEKQRKCSPGLRMLAVAVLAAAAAGTLVHRASRMSLADAALATAAPPSPTLPAVLPPAGGAPLGPATGQQSEPAHPVARSDESLEGRVKAVADAALARQRAGLVARRRATEKRSSGSAPARAPAEPAHPTAATGRVGSLPPASTAGESELPAGGASAPERAHPPEDTSFKPPKPDWVQKKAPDFLL